jgi:hypothetical protein
MTRLQTRISLIRPKVDTIKTMMVDQKVDKSKNNPECPLKSHSKIIMIDIKRRQNNPKAIPIGQ